MRAFTHLEASSVSEASRLAESGATMLIAGGTDALGVLKDEILPTYPARVVDLKTIANLAFIAEEGDIIKIGALTTLDAIAHDAAINAKATCLAQAAARTSAPIQRKMGTLGGNVCQMHRCWYFRVPENRFHCLRKGGDYCPATIGDCRYHSIFGAVDGCIAVSPHDTAPALIALDATVVTNKARYAAEDFFAVAGVRSNVLAAGEVVTEIHVPTASKSAFMKFSERKAIDFPVVNCAAAVTANGVRIACGGVYPTPLRMTAAEQAVAGGITEKTAQEAGDAAVAAAKPLSKNAYKVEITRTLVKRTLKEIAR